MFLKKYNPSENWIKFTAYVLNQSFVVRFLSPFPRLQWPAMRPRASTASHEADYPCKSPQPKQRFPFAQMTQAWSHSPWGWLGLVWMPRLPIFPLCFVSGRWKEGNSNSKWWFVNNRLEMLLWMLVKVVFEEMFLYVLPLLSCSEGSKLFLCFHLRSLSRGFTYKLCHNVSTATDEQCRDKKKNCGMFNTTFKHL